MMKLSRMENSVVIAVSVAGMGVAASAAIFKSFEQSKSPHISMLTEATTDDQNSVIANKNPIPAFKKELLHSCEESYTALKNPLSKLFRFVGQMFVAPIVVLALDTAYAAYTGHSNSPSLEVIPHSLEANPPSFEATPPLKLQL